MPIIETYSIKKRMLLISAFIFVFCLTYGQNRHINIGYNDNGICIGNSKKTNGFRLNIFDKNVDIINGFNIAFISHCYQTNGFKLSFHSISKVTNGLNLTLWGIDDSITNGIAIATGIGGSKINGFGIGLLAIAADTLNGFYLSGLIGTSNTTSDPIKLVNGVSIGVLAGVDANELNGLAVGIYNVTEIQRGVVIGILNKTMELHGFQFGLINYAGNNRKIFRFLPIFNFNLRKKINK